MWRTSWLAVLVTLLASTPVVAQVCAGFPSFRGRPIQIVGAAAFNDNSKTFGGGVGFGGAGAFGSLELVTAHIDAFDASAFVVGGSVGYQVPLDKKGAVQLCPGAGVEFAIGPKNINGTGVDYSETDVSLGVSVGVVAARTAKVDVVPTGAIAFAHSDGKLKDASGNSVSNSEWFGVVGFGIGFVFSYQVSIRPAVSIPFGVNGASTSFGVTLAVNFGGAR